MTDRSAVHQSAVYSVMRRLRRRGHRVQRIPHDAGGYSILVDDQIRVAVRGARVVMRRHRVTFNGKQYHYRYRVHAWGFHAHGVRRCLPDIWCLVPAGRPAATLVIPGAVVGPTRRNVALLLDVGESRRRPSRWRQYVGCWELVGPVGRQRRAA